MTWLLPLSARPARKRANRYHHGDLRRATAAGGGADDSQRTASMA